MNLRFVFIFLIGFNRQWDNNKKPAEERAWMGIYPVFLVPRVGVDPTTKGL